MHHWKFIYLTTSNVCIRWVITHVTCKFCCISSFNEWYKPWEVCGDINKKQRYKKHDYKLVLQWHRRPMKPMTYRSCGWNFCHSFYRPAFQFSTNILHNKTQRPSCHFIFLFSVSSSLFATIFTLTLPKEDNSIWILYVVYVCIKY